MGALRLLQRVGDTSGEEQTLSRSSENKESSATELKGHIWEK